MKPWEIVSFTLQQLKNKAVVGANLVELDKMAEKIITSYRGVPFNKGYKPDWASTPYPATLCIGVNDVTFHGIPQDYDLRDGDIVSFDLSVIKDGVCGDAALTVGVGNISSRDDRLIRNAYKTLQAGIEKVRAGVFISEISKAINDKARLEGYVTIITFAGHGIGKEMHEEPMIPNDPSFVKKDEQLKEGQMICLEPQLTYKDRYGKKDADGWTYRTTDGKNAAFFEHQILVLKDSYKLLTNY